MKDDFGDRMKEYERRFTAARVTPDQWLAVRIDGKTFSSYTRGFEKPFDQALTDAMKTTMVGLVEETHANIGYTQSDEITLIYSLGEKQNEHIFGGKLSKINSILASMATAYFNRYMASSHIPTSRPAFFDCRAWAVPTPTEASNVLLWRVQDARKNSISAMFHAEYGHKAMHGLSGKQMKKRLAEDNNPWELLPNRWKYGIYAKRVAREVQLDEATLEKIPVDKRPKDGIVTRSFVEEVDYGYFGDMPLEERIKAVTRR
jgi:tRNA(His) guanylyltransferase